MAEAVVGYAEAGMRSTKPLRAKRMKLDTKDTSKARAVESVAAAATQADSSGARPMDVDRAAGRHLSILITWPDVLPHIDAFKRLTGMGSGSSFHRLTSLG